MTSFAAHTARTIPRIRPPAARAGGARYWQRHRSRAYDPRPLYLIPRRASVPMIVHFCRVKWRARFMVARVALSVQRQVRCLSCDVTREVNFMAGMRAAHKPALREWVPRARVGRREVEADRKAYV